MPSPVMSVAKCEAELIGAKADVAHWAGASVSLHPLREAKIAKSNTGESESAKSGVGEIGLRRDRDQHRSPSKPIT